MAFYQNTKEKISNFYRITPAWTIQIILYYILRLIRCRYRSGQNKLRHYLHLILNNGKIKLISNGVLKTEYLFEENKISLMIRPFPSSDIEVFEQIFYNQEYKFIKDKLEPLVNTKKEISVIDAGSNIGLTTIYLSLFFPHLSCVCIEPDEENIILLNQNLELNNIAQRTKVLQMGIWSDSTYLKVNNNFRDGKSWSLSVEKASSSDFDIKAISLHDVINRYTNGIIDFCKVDIEGAEKQVFNSKLDSQKFLKNINLISVEIHDEYDCRAQIESIIKENHFDLTHCGELSIGTRM